MKQVITAAISDSVARLFSDDLIRSAIDDAIEYGQISANEIVEEFRTELLGRIGTSGSELPDNVEPIGDHASVCESCQRSHIIAKTMKLVCGRAKTHVLICIDCSMKHTNKLVDLIRSEINM